MSNCHPKVLLYLKESIIKNHPKGGPYGVGALYYNEQLKRNENFFSFLKVRDTTPPKTLSNIFTNSHWLIMLKRRIRTLLFFINIPHAATRDFGEYDIVFFHQPSDLFREKDNLANFDGIVVLQSHCPEPESHEICKNNGLDFGLIKKFCERSDRFAFERADYVVFPCQEAEEPYIKGWKYFPQFEERKRKQFRFIPTGIVPLLAKRESVTIRDELNIPNESFVVCYVGRHNKIKGYDIIKNIASRYFANHDDTWFVIGGKEGPLRSLDHPRWIEIGWTNDAASYISASDVFFLPNRETYYDLVMLEILSLGKIVIASRTGGNRFFEKEGVKGVFLYDSVDEAIELLQKVNDMSHESRLELGDFNRRYFLDHCQVESMYDKCKNLMIDLWNNKLRNDGKV